MDYNAIIVGGGFYGASIAEYLKTRRHFDRVLLIEKEDALLKRASYNNQARVHNGYHYPRSLTTAYRSRINLPRFVHDHPQAIKRDFTKVYAIARRSSKVSAKQFIRFCNQIGAIITPAPAAISALFSPQLIEAVFQVEEYVFDALLLAQQAADALAAAAIDVRLNCTLTALAQDGTGRLTASICDHRGNTFSAHAPYVFNCTYSGLNQLRGDYPGTGSELKHEITEMALVKPAEALAGLGITVMDGPFFSLMPFPAAGEQVCTLSHVRFTPHLAWQDSPQIDPYERLRDYAKISRSDRMLRDSARYLPALADTQPIGSLFEVKTVLVKNETDDGRPILFERHTALPGCYSVLGGKIDNIYDVFDRLDAEELTLG